MINKTIKLVQFLFEYLRDFVFAIRYNTYSPFEDKNRKLYYQIIILSHSVEKGLSLNSPRMLFGQDKIRQLIRMVQSYDPNYSSFPLQMVRGALSFYLIEHKRLGVASPFLDEVEKCVNDKSIFGAVTSTGGFRDKSPLPLITNEMIKSRVSFLESRFSCRAYEASCVDQELIEKIVATAQSAPSQCNRQSVRVHCYQVKPRIEQLLRLQGGSTGFSELVHNLFIITSESTAWGGFGQRNQGYVDGGLFSMQLLLACHAHGLGICALNLAVGNAQESTIKKIADIPPRERLIMMMAFGYPVESGLKAAKSPRIPLEEVLQVH